MSLLLLVVGARRAGSGRAPRIVQATQHASTAVAVDDRPTRIVQASDRPTRIVDAG